MRIVPAGACGTTHINEIAIRANTQRLNTDRCATALAESLFPGSILVRYLLMKKVNCAPKVGHNVNEYER